MRRGRQAGFTLLELTVAMAVGALILSAVGATLFQVWNNNMRNTAHMIALKQIENAFHFLIRDVQMAQTVEVSGDNLTLGWVTWDGQTDTIDYLWNADNRTLTRVRSVDGIPSVVAYSVYPAPVFTIVGDSKLSADISTTVKGITEERLMQIVRRPGS